MQTPDEMKVSRKLHLVSLGCSKNLVDSEVMLGRLREYELTDNAGEADLLIVNTCGFLAAAREESIAAVVGEHLAFAADDNSKRRRKIGFFNRILIGGQ